MQSKILPIAGDASFRKFYRLIKNNKSKIIVLSNKEKYKNLIAYTSVNKFLRSNRIYAPKLYKYNFKKGIIVIEDFGDLSFYKLLVKKKNKLVIYKKIVDLLLKIQKIKPKIRIKNIGKGSHIIKKYSNIFLHNETDLFFNWYLPFFLKKKRCLNIKKKTKNILTKLYNKLNFPNSYLVHRDYHAQNLMKFGNKIGVIDSQDALIGNPAYDLVSLIDDVRIKTPEKLKKQIYSYYLKRAFKNHRIYNDKFLADFNILSVQRNLKIIGIFSRLYTRDKKGQYLKYIPYAWKLLEKRMEGEMFLDLKRIINKNVPTKIRKKIIKQ